LRNDTDGNELTLDGVDLGIVAASLSLSGSLDARSLEVNVRDSFSLDYPVSLDELNLRVLGDHQNLTITTPLAVTQTIQLVASDGQIDLPGGTQLTTSTVVLKARKVTTASDQLNLSVDTLTLITSPREQNSLVINNSRSLLLTASTDDQHLVPIDDRLTNVFSGITWPRTADEDWKASMYDTQSNIYALRASDAIVVVLPPSVPGQMKPSLRIEGRVRSYEEGLTFVADGIDFLGGMASIEAPGDLAIRASSATWLYRLGTSAESGGGGKLQSDPLALDLASRDLAALANGFSSITIGREGSGNAMRIGDAFALSNVKATEEIRRIDSALKDATTLLAGAFVVEGDFRAPQDSLTLRGQSAEILALNLHTPNKATVDSGLTARQLNLLLTDTLQVGGWLIATDRLDIEMTDTAGDFSLISDFGSAIQQTGKTGTLVIRGKKGMRVAGMVLAAADGATPVLDAGTRLDLIAGSDIAVTGADATLHLAARDQLVLNVGSVVRAGVAVDFPDGAPQYTILGERSKVEIASPHELLLAGLVVSSDELVVTAGTGVQDHGDYFDALLSGKPEHYLFGRDRYAILLTGTLVVLGDDTALNLSSAEDIILLGNVQLAGTNTAFTVHSDRFIYLEGEIDVADRIEVLSGVGVNGTFLGNGADERGTSVYVGETGTLITREAGSQVVIRGAQDVDIYASLIAGGVVGESGVTWNGEGSSIELVAGQQLIIGDAVQASGNVMVQPGLPGPDDAGQSLIFCQDPD
jgi:hypothetical protein